MSRARKEASGEGEGRGPRLRLAGRGKSVGQRMREQDRELADATAEQRRRRHAARGVYDAIGFESMWADGICEVERGLFSQTVAFSDISYQSARKEAQEAVFSAWCQLLDGFGADSSVQLSITNTPIPAEEIGSRSFFDESDPVTGRFAAEYNRILNDKMREGISNLVRTRHLTYAVGARDVESAVPRLARIRGEVTQALQRVRCEVEPLDGPARLAAMGALIRPGRRIPTDWSLLAAHTGLRAKDLVCPGCIESKPGGSASKLRIDGTWCQALVFRSFGSELMDRCIAEIVDLPIPLSVSIHVQGMDKARAVSFVKQRLAWMDKEIIDEQRAAVKRGYDYTILPSELRYSKEEAEDLLDDLQNKNQRLFRYTGLAWAYADTEAELDERVLQITRAARSNSIELEALDYRQREGMNSILPLGNNHVDVGRFMTTAEIAVQMPFATQELNQEGGGYYGQNKESSNLVICNRKRLASPMGYVAGKPGSGKSFSVKREIENTILAYPDDQVIVFDPAGEYSSVVVPNGGTCIRLGPDSDAHLNPFDLADVEGHATASQRAFKIDAFLALSGATMAEGRQGLPEADKSIISRCVEDAYERCAAEGRVPVLADLYEGLLAQPEPEARGIALRYERYVRGATSFFSHESNVGFDARITCVDLRDLSQNMRTFGMLTALESVRNRMYANFERGVTTWLYIDEVQSLFEHPSIVSYFSKFWAEGRKFNLICTGITQNSVYMLEHEEARNMVLNSDFVLLHKQSPLDRRAWADLLGLSEREEGYIDESAKPGEGLLIAGAARVPIKDDFPRGQLYDLFNTKPDEVAELKRASGGRGAR
ncbi:VirB4-like conjugal transfer ATPase, CD1110 family [Parafannyhessea umbonata]|uniref:VirB4-like conjugal transfer ATPase, CD1110 family n=1 Tax=Parafannyhessea TaxID=2847312 RepID=UPI003F9AD982